MKLLLLLTLLVSQYSFAGNKSICIHLGFEDYISGEVSENIPCRVIHEISESTSWEEGSSRWICETKEGRKVGLFSQKESGVNFFDLGTGAFEPVEFAKLKLSTTVAFGNGTYFEPFGKFALKLFGVEAFDLDTGADHNRSLNLYYPRGKLELDAFSFAFAGSNGEFVELSIKEAYQGACK